MSAALTQSLQLLAAFQCGCFALFLLAGPPRKRRTNLYLGGALALLSLHLTTLYFVRGGLTPAHLAGLLYGPLFLGYVRGALDLRWHLLPSALALGLMLAGALTGERLAAMVFVSLGGYLLASARVVLRGEGGWWRRFAVAGLSIIYLLDVTSFATSRPDGGASIIAAVLFGALLLYVTTFVFAGLQRPQLFVFAEAAAWTDDDRDELERLERLMLARRLFLDPELSVAQLADASGLQARRVSVLINRGRGRNFADWVNGYRIDEARRMLVAEEKSVLEILFACGFNSKSTFNAAFKSATGLTPTRFRRDSRPET